MDKRKIILEDQKTTVPILAAPFAGGEEPEN